VATSAASIAKTGKYGDLRRRLVFLLLALVVYRIGAHIPVPGIDPAQLQAAVQRPTRHIEPVQHVLGWCVSRFTVFALGIMPYISASIIMQLMTYAVPTFEQLKKGR
jgi:preprotein translocase subunit SecY